MYKLADLTQPALLEIGDDELAEIGLILELRRNFGIAVYKDKCMKRRIAIRMRSCHCLDAAAYCQLLRQDERELDLLVKTLTIHVSQFFRNPTMFEKLRSTVLPQIFSQAASDGGTLRIWSLGCAGGEEAYSLAMLLRESFPQQLQQTALLIEATDIDPEILQAARKGQYSEERLKDLPPEYRQRYFTVKGSLMQLSPAITEMVTFSQGNICFLKDVIRHDLILCRNTLIYFNRCEQENILQGIAENLTPGGILVLGKSETLVGDVRRRFSIICPLERIYRKT